MNNSTGRSYEAVSRGYHNDFEKGKLDESRNLGGARGARGELAAGEVARAAIKITSNVSSTGKIRL